MRFDGAARALTAAPVPLILPLACPFYEPKAYTVPYSETTHSIRVTVEPFFLEDQSEPNRNHFVWAYRVRILNEGNDTVRLLNRHWRITDSLGRMQEVLGSGVVGEQPLLKAGESFEYTSGTPLPTPSGIMVGSYEMESVSGERFAVRIPAFSLDSPHESRKIN